MHRTNDNFLIPKPLCFLATKRKRCLGNEMRGTRSVSHAGPASRLEREDTTKVPTMEGRINNQQVLLFTSDHPYRILSWKKRFYDYAHGCREDIGLKCSDGYQVLLRSARK